MTARTEPARRARLALAAASRRAVASVATPRRAARSAAHAARSAASTLKSAGAESAEFLSQPLGLLFPPLVTVAVGALPLLVPLFLVPFRVLAAYVAFAVLWYLIMLGLLAAEIAIRPPWYRPGELGLHDVPAYWLGVTHDPQTDLGLSYVDVEFPSRRNRRMLRGWYIPGDVPGDIVLCVHGAGRDRRALMRHSGMLHALGFGVLLFDFSEHGLSDGNRRGFAFGVREQHDVRAAYSYVVAALGARRVVLFGTSAGASACILAAAGMPGDFAAVVAENPISRPADVFTFHLEQLTANYLAQDKHRLLRHVVFAFWGRLLLLRIGLFGMNIGAADVVTDIGCPLFVIHGTADDIVPIAQGREVFARAAEPKTWWEVPDSAHCAMYDRQPAEYRARLCAFLQPSFPDRALA